jgi:hypothetical protein
LKKIKIVEKDLGKQEKKKLNETTQEISNSQRKRKAI